MDEQKISDLRNSLKGALYTDRPSCVAYSVDASIYQVEPQAIVQPTTSAEVVSAIRWAASHELSVTVRGAGTGIAGSCLGKGLIIDTSAHLTAIEAFDLASKTVICGAGVIQSDLNRFLRPYKLRLGPDTSTGNRATLGGMVGANAAGAHSLRYGMMADALIAAEVVLSSGTAVGLTIWDRSSGQVEPSPSEFTLVHEDSRSESCLKQLLAGLTLLAKERHAPLEELAARKLPRNASGYCQLPCLIEPRCYLAKLLAGAEGSLGIVTKVKLQLVDLPSETALLLLPLPSLRDGLEKLSQLLSPKLFALELLDRSILQLAEQKLGEKALWLWQLVHGAEALLIAEVDGENREEIERQLEELEILANELQIKPSLRLTDQKRMAELWEIREAGLGLLLSKRSYSRAIAFIEDFAVPPKNLSSLLGNLLPYLGSIGKQYGLYGHVGAGCLHLRPYFDLRDPKEAALMVEVMKKTAAMVIAAGGVMSGEHGDGLSRSWLNPLQFGDELYAAFVRLKDIFDPINLMNPGKVVDGRSPLIALRQSHDCVTRPFEPFLDFSKEGGLDLSVDLCNGNGLCRKKSGVMCPSFQATGDERETTRARAQAVRHALFGGGEHPPLSLREAAEILHDCLECKGCKSECPSSVDMAKIKMELFYQLQKAEGAPLRSWLLAHISLMSRLAARHAPRLVNFLMNSHVGKWGRALVGITTRYPLPSVTQRTFSLRDRRSWALEEASCALYIDTFSESYAPEIAEGALALLELVGERPLIFFGGCCGRPLLSKGYLPAGREAAERLLKQSQPLFARKLRLLVLEPSCCSAFVEDYPSLVSEPIRPDAELLARSTDSFTVFLSKHPQLAILREKLRKETPPIGVHVHCHQQSTKAKSAILDLFDKLSIPVVALGDGCCGMAGSFGYEQEHELLSEKIGKRSLAPLLGLAENIPLIADGFSCRTQLLHIGQKKAYHIAEWLAKEAGLLR